MSKIELLSKLDGHNRQAGRWEKQAKREGKNSHAYKMYCHHLDAWLETKKEIKSL